MEHADAQADAETAIDIETVVRDDSGSANPDPHPQWQATWRDPEVPNENFSRYSSNANVKPSVENTIASADIQNPSDALEILAQVAGDAGTADRAASTATASDMVEQANALGQEEGRETLFSYPPYISGAISLNIISELFSM